MCIQVNSSISNITGYISIIFILLINGHEGCSAEDTLVVILSVSSHPHLHPTHPVQPEAVPPCRGQVGHPGGGRLLDQTVLHHAHEATNHIGAVNLHFAVERNP